MMYKHLLAFVLVLMVALTAVALAGDDEQKGDQTRCPVMGNPINKDSYVDYNSYRVFFCCDGCKAEFAKDPESYMQKMKAEGVQPMKLKAQSICPVSGEKLMSMDVYTDYKGKRVYFCCPNCVKAFESDPEKYLKVLADRGEAPETLKKGDEK